MGYFHLPFPPYCNFSLASTRMIFLSHSQESVRRVLGCFLPSLFIMAPALSSLAVETCAPPNEGWYLNKRSFWFPFFFPLRFEFISWPFWELLFLSVFVIVLESQFPVPRWPWLFKGLFLSLFFDRLFISCCGVHPLVGEHCIPCAPTFLFGDFVP